MKRAYAGEQVRLLRARNLLVLCPFLAFVALSSNASAQQSIVDASSQLNIRSGNITADDLYQGQFVLTFFLPEDCLACEEVDAWYQNASIPSDVKFIFVTREDTVALEAWLKRYPDRNVWIDAEFTLALELGVQQAPSTFFVRNGEVVNAAFWPFDEVFGGLDLLTRAFAAGSFTGTLTDSSKVGQLLPTVALRTGSGEVFTADELMPSSLLIYCSTTCGACQDEMVSLETMYTEAVGNAPVYLVVDVEDESALAALGLNWSELPMKLLFDVNGNFGKAMALDGTPAHIFLDQEKKVSRFELGYGEDLLQEIETLMAVDPRNPTTLKGE